MIIDILKKFKKTYGKKKTMSFVRFFLYGQCFTSCVALFYLSTSNVRVIEYKTLFLQ